MWMILIILLFCTSPDRYFDRIYTVENRILNFQFQEAAIEYEEIFSEEGIPFLKDVHNALVCAIKANDNRRIEIFAKYLTEFNIAEEYLSSAIFSDSIKEEPVWHYIESAILTSNIMGSDLISALDSVYAKDQNIREGCKKLSLNYNIACKDTILFIDSINLSTLREIFENYGLPNDSRYLKYHPGNIPDYFWIIYHNTTHGRHDLDSFLLAAVKKMSLHPQLYAYNLGTLNGDKKYTEFGLGYSIKLKGNLYIFDIPDSELEHMIDLNRKSIHLESISKFNKKIIFQFFNPEFKLIYPGLLASFTADDETNKMLEEKWKDSKVKAYNQH